MSNNPGIDSKKNSNISTYYQVDIHTSEKNLKHAICFYKTQKHNCTLFVCLVSLSCH